MPRINRESVAIACIALVVCVAILPGLSTITVALFQPTWVLLADLPVTLIARPVSISADHALSLFANVPPRAPPFPA
jgi:hypothetical protein